MSAEKINDNKADTGSATSRRDAGKAYPTIGVIFIVLLLGLLAVAYVIEEHLPTALCENDEIDHPESFITERAKKSLKALTDLGSRITGSYSNEVLAVKVLTNEIKHIIHSANETKIIEMDVQSSSGAFNWYGIGSLVIVAYANIQNIVVKLHGKNPTHSILINAHFDTKPIGPGGSDDGINCANMLEILRKLAKSKETFEHDIIFLLNGSEEQGLHGSHVFITQHKWAKEIKVIVNLDAAGSGGGLTVFRTGPKRPWVMKYYKNVPYPKGQVAAEEVFGTGLVPSDTDFSVFSEIGGLVGFDLGYYKDGYRYHTSYDGFENIPDGTYQHGGANVLALVRGLANAPELAMNEDELSSENLVYYDYLGLFFVSYSETTGIIINVLTVLVSTCVSAKNLYDLGLPISKKTLRRLGITLMFILLGWILAVAFVVIIATLLDVSKQGMSWYSHPWLLLGLYAAPVLAITSSSITALNYIAKKDHLSVSAITQIQAHLVTFIWAIVLLLGTILRIRSIFAVQIMILFQTIAYIVIILARLQKSRRTWIAVYILGTLIPNIFLMVQSLVLISFFVPITGRGGSGSNTEILIGFTTLLVTLLITSVYTPIITMIRKPYIILAVLTAVFVLFFVLALTPVGFPYKGGNIKSPAPQRYWIHHTSRVLRTDTNAIKKSDGGFFVSNLDRNSPGYVEKYVRNFANATSITEDCQNYIFCGLPLAKFRSFGITWIPADKPFVNKSVNLVLESKTVNNNLTRLSFTVSGPHFIDVYISPRQSVSLTRIDLIPEKPQQIQLWNERPVYVIQYACGKATAPLKFTVDLETADSYSGEYVTDIAVAGRYLHTETNIMTEQYKEFVKQFPDWTDVVPWLAVYESWVF